MKIIVLIALIMIGAIGYIEKILKFQFPRRHIIFLFLLFLIFSATQLILSVDSDKNISSLNATIEKSADEISKLREKTAAQDKKIVSLETDLDVSSRNLSETKNRLSDTLTYSEVATWTLDGSKSLGGVAVSSPVAGWFKDYIIKKGERVEWKCDSEATEYYKNMTKRYPTYPYPYYFLASCLKNHGQKHWTDIAQQGAQICEKIVKIPNHEPGYEWCLARLKELQVSKN
jgi:hypothetical protein